MEKSEPGSGGGTGGCFRRACLSLALEECLSTFWCLQCLFHFNDKLVPQFDLLEFLKEGVEKPGDSSVSKVPCKHEDMCSVTRARVKASSCGVCM